MRKNLYPSISYGKIQSLHSERRGRSIIYCVSDIHGELDKFERLLELIQLSDADQLYIIGDVIDRGAMGVDILQKIMAAPNMTMLLGNHEQMCLDTLGPHNEYGARDLWAAERRSVHLPGAALLPDSP